MLLSVTGQAAVLQTWTGPTTVTGGGVGTMLVNTTNDTGNWINSHGDYTTGNPITPTETVSFVLKLDQASNSATVWFNPNFALTETGQDTGLTTYITGLGIEDTFDGVWLRAGLTTGSSTFSAMSVRDNSPFAAVPEPSSSLYLFIAGLAFIFFLKRETQASDYAQSTLRVPVRS